MTLYYNLRMETPQPALDTSLPPALPQRSQRGGCLIPAALAFVLLILVILVAVLALRANTDLFGLLAPDFTAYTPNRNYTRYNAADGRWWELGYETTKTRAFSGEVRYAGPIRVSRFPLLTHDLLITSGDFTDPLKVTTSVVDHKFFWASNGETYPQGNINLLHIVPKTEEIYRQLLEIREGDTVRITGVEIQRITAFSASGENLGWWQDAGCNTITVISVEPLE